MELTPKQIVRELDRYIIGQHEAKRAVAVALRNRYRRAQLPEEIRDEIVPKNILSEIGKVCDKYINNINSVYENISVDKYVIMPNHIHLLVVINGTMRASSPTSGIETVVRTLKTMVTKEIGYSVWQRSYHDHIIRSEEDHKKIWEYIDTNVLKWKEDCFYR